MYNNIINASVNYNDRQRFLTYMIASEYLYNCSVLRNGPDYVGKYVFP